MLRVLGLLAALSAAINVLALATAGPLYRYHLSWSSIIGQEAGGWIALFLASAMGALIAALLTRKQRNAYPGFGTGVTIAIVFGGMSWIGRLGPTALSALR